MTVEPAPTRAWLRVARDVFVGLVVFAALWLTVSVDGSTERITQIVLGSIAIVGVLLRQRWPVPAVVTTAVATVIAWGLGVTADPMLLTSICLYSVAKLRGKRQVPWWLLLVSGVVVLLVLAVSADGLQDRVRPALLAAVLLALSWVLGVRTRLMRDASATRSRTEERLRLAREVHDVLSHSLGTIGVRAGVAAHVSSLDESALRDTLRDIEESARESMGELKELLIRERTGEVSGAQHDDAQSMVLADAIDAIAQAARHSGLSVDVKVDDAVSAVPTAIQTTAQRIVQEAVTNAIRHADATNLSITVTHGQDRVELWVVDDGQGAGPEFREGIGLTGMRERAALAGGALTAESSKSGGFVVHAVLPCAAATGQSDGAP